MLSKGEYTVDTEEILGTGSFGIVHKAKDNTDKEIAAKRIDFTSKTEKKFPQVARDLQKLTSLSHVNIVRIFEVLEEKSTIWVFMELCDHGDLIDYLQGDEASHLVSNSDKFKLMMDIAKGVEYLHSKNIIHRDIKPGNILIAGFPATAKLSDFDCSKFFEEDYNSSLMSSNVGTQAFKAPEFYLRTDTNKLEYHRNVDVYAMGLTFLAMIQNHKFLIPKLETPNEAAEWHFPYTIGMLIAERKRYGDTPLHVVKVVQEQFDGHKLWGDVRREILKMTHEEPSERASAAEVVQSLKRVKVQVRESCRKGVFVGLVSATGLLSDSRVSLNTRYHNRNAHCMFICFSLF